MEGIGNVLRYSDIGRQKKKTGGPIALPGLETFEPRPKEKHLHSEEHVLADEMCRYFGEPHSGKDSKYGAYYGVVKRLGLAQARAVFSAVKSDVKDVQNPRKLFMWMTGAPKDPLAPKVPRLPEKNGVKSKSKNKIHASHSNATGSKAPRKVRRGHAGGNTQARLPGLA